MTNHAFTSNGLLTRALACGAALCLSLAAQAADSASPHWSYAGETGPEHWGFEDPAFAACATGKHQSPINIDKTAVKDLPKLKFDYKKTALKVTDTGHSFQVNAESGSGGLTVGEDRYEFVQVHFHQPSEERVRGQQYPMVAHIVHKNAKGELAVVAVLMRTGRTNTALAPIFDHFPEKGTAENDVTGKAVDIAKFLPKHHGYYTFDGSLTTPPCSEHVRWFVLKTPVEVSEKQLEQFGARYAHDNRPTQLLNDRLVEESSSD